MTGRRRGIKLLSLLAGASLAIAACGGDDGDGEEGTTTPSEETTAAPDTTAGGEETSTTAAEETTTSAAGGDETTTTGVPATLPTGETAMTITYDLNPAAVWEDGTPITVADFVCSWHAKLLTPGSISTVGYDQITAVEAGTSDKQVVVSFKTVYAPYKNLFSAADLIKEAATEGNCDDVSALWESELPFSGNQWILESWSPEQAVLVPNEAYWGSEKPIASSVVMVPKEDTDTEIASLVSGEVDFIFPQAYNGITDALNDPNISYTPGYGTNYEALWFQQQDGPLADPDFRAAFSMSIDRSLILSQIYDPIFPGAPLLNCGVWVPTIGPWCDQTAFENSYDPAAAEALLTEAGWVKDAEGFWTKDGAPAPEIRWVVNTGNTRRETTQALMIPELEAAGFKVVADNCDAACYFQQRVPALDYDLAMYIQTVQPDPTVSTILHCNQVPSAANNNRGQNTAGWCNEEASALMDQADATIGDDATRTDLTHQIAHLMAEDHVMLPLFQFPNIAAWRTDRLSGPIDKDAGNYTAWQNVWEWQPLTSDQILIGAEQWPGCVNPITECANSSWYVWTTAFKVMPAVFATNADGTYSATELVTGEPTVEIVGG